MNKVYLLDITNHCHDFNFNINNKRLEEANKFQQSKNYFHSIYAWLLLKYVVNINYNIDIDTIELLKNEYNKPYFKSNFHFNISHSHNYICVAISSNEIGVDIELVNEKLHTEKLTRKVLTEEEKEQYNKSIMKDDFFFLQWTKKEAYLKQIGIGLKKDMTTINVNNVYSIDLYDEEGQKYYLSVIPHNDIYIEKIDINKII